MWQFIIGSIVGGTTVATAVWVMNQKLNTQKKYYDGLLRDSNKKLTDLTNKDAYRQGRDDENEHQRQYRARLHAENDTLRAENNDLRRQLGLECIFEHKLKTNGKAIVTVR